MPCQILSASNLIKIWSKKNFDNTSYSVFSTYGTFRVNKYTTHMNIMTIEIKSQLFGISDTGKYTSQSKAIAKGFTINVTSRLLVNTKLPHLVPVK